jgi:hypothetical protein
LSAAAAEALATLAGGSPPSPFPSPSGATTTLAPPAPKKLLAATLALLSPFAETHGAPEVRLRAYSLAAAIAGRGSPAAAAAVARCGLMVGGAVQVESRTS